MELYPFDEWTGRRISWVRTADYDPAKGGVNYRRLMKQPGKRLQTPEAQMFLDFIRGAGENVDPLVPWLANQYKKGQLRYGPIPGKKMYDYSNGAANPEIVDDDRPAFQRRNPRYIPPEDREEGVQYGRYATEEWDALPIHALRQWSDWYNAREHPTRRGVNVQDPNFGVTEIEARSKEHVLALEEEERRQENIEAMQNSEAEVVHTFPDGWTVRRLHGQEDAELEGEVMDHCIGSDDQPSYEYPYTEAISDGTISAFSLRDPDGIPHMTWHYNPDGSLAEVHGTGNQTPRDDYRARFEDWSKQKGMPTTAEGNNGWEDQNNYDESWDLTMNDPKEFINLFSEYNDDDEINRELYEWAQGDGANFNPEAYEGPDINLNIDYDAIAKALIERGNPVAQQKFLKAMENSPVDQWGRRKDAPQMPLFEDTASPYGLRPPPARDLLGDIFDAIKFQAEEGGRYDFPEAEDHMDSLAAAIKNQKPDPKYKEEHASVLNWLDDLERQWSFPPGYDTGYSHIGPDTPQWDEIGNVATGYEDYPPEERALTDPGYAPPLWSDDFSGTQQSVMWDDARAVYWVGNPQNTFQTREEASASLQKDLPWWWPKDYSPYSDETHLEDEDPRVLNQVGKPFVAHSIWNKP